MPSLWPAWKQTGYSNSKIDPFCRDSVKPRFRTTGQGSGCFCRSGSSIFSQKKRPHYSGRMVIFCIWQHRTIQREHSARDFLSRRDLESADVLCVHQTFQTDGSAKNIRRRPKMQLCGVALICQRHRAASQKTSFVLAVRFRKSPPRTCAAGPSARASGGSASPRRR